MAFYLESTTYAKVVAQLARFHQARLFVTHPWLA